jgi:HEAT repeat protein
MGVSARRLLVPVIGMAGFMLLCTASLLHQRRRPEESATRGSPPPPHAETAQGLLEGPAAPARSSQEGYWFHRGDPVLIATLIERLDQLQRGGADLKPYCDKLIQDMGDVLWKNGIHALKLMKRILCDETLPKELRESVLRWSSSSLAPEVARFLADLISEGKIAPDVVGEAMDALSGLSRFFTVDADTALRAAGRRAYDVAAASPDPKARAAAISRFRLLGGSGELHENTEALLRIFRSDPALEVQTAATSVLRFSGLVQGSEPIAAEMAGIVSRSTDYWTRFNALSVLMATETDLAKKTVLNCLADENDSVRHVAIGGVGLFQLTEALPLLARLLTGPEQGDADTQIYCIYSLQLMPTLESARALLQYVATEEETSLRYKAATALMENKAVNQEELAQDLIGLYETRKNTPEGDVFIDLLGVNDTERAYGVLTAAYASATPDRQSRIASVLLGYGHAGVFAAENFAALVATDNGASAVRALGEGNKDRAVAEISKAYGREGVSDSTRRAAIEVLEKVGSLYAVGVLERLLKTETNEDRLRDIRSALDRILDNP